MFNSTRFAILVVAASFGALTLTASASAAQRVATPTGSGTACTAAAPCDLRTAVESAASGDEVIVNSGTYNLSSQLDLPGAASVLDVHGAAGQPRPLIVTNAENGVLVNRAAQTLSDVEIDHSGRNTALHLAQGMAERVVVHSSGFAACSPFGSNSVGAVLRDSVCWNTRAAGGWGVATTAGGTGISTIAPKLRNVTAVTTSASAPAVAAQAGDNTTIAIDARNVIAQSPGVDVDASSNGVGGSSSTVTLRTSNFANVAITPGSSVTSPSANGNQAAPAAFVNAGAGNFRQAPGSPTIDAGSVDGPVGWLDFERDDRIQNAQVDIGADEIDNVAPQTDLLEGPLGTTDDPTPTFTFTSPDSAVSFQCSLDGAPFGACSGARTHTTAPLADGSHSFAVRAVDAAGNADPTPERREFTVRTTTPPAADTDPPEVTIDRGPARRTPRRRASLAFSSDEARTTFECVIDSRPLRSCGSPTRYRRLVSGRHLFLVFATDAAGNLDETPARFRWRVTR